MAVVESERLEIKIQYLNGRRAIAARELMGETNKIVIIHDGETYELRLTRFGKLVLNK
ncbi:MAG: hemin uptake protein HemP [Burkholderiaceae bacterium]|jgi:hemin uptake protein HemP|nr:hemin uptake protein HemP [Burkholderiaceae bacterium]